MISGISSANSHALETEKNPGRKDMWGGFEVQSSKFEVRTSPFHTNKDPD